MPYTKELHDELVDVDDPTRLHRFRQQYDYEWLSAQAAMDPRFQSLVDSRAESATPVSTSLVRTPTQWSEISDVAILYNVMFSGIEEPFQIHLSIDFPSNRGDEPNLRYKGSRSTGFWSVLNSNHPYGRFAFLYVMRELRLRSHIFGSEAERVKLVRDFFESDAKEEILGTDLSAVTCTSDNCLNDETTIRALVEILHVAYKYDLPFAAFQRLLFVVHPHRFSNVSADEIILQMNARKVHRS